MAGPPVDEMKPFPTEIAEFDEDERISYSKLDGKYIAVRADGAEFEFNPGLKRWVLLADEEEEKQIAAAQAAYGGSHSDEDAAQADGAGKQGRKRKQEYGEQADAKTKRSNMGDKRQRASQAPRQPKQNTAVYVTGLPADATVDEVAELFSRKCGVIAEEIDSGRPRIKLYTDAEGQFKGDALIVFFKPQSVDMAIMLLDDTDFRYSPAGGPRMRVQAADASYKKMSYEEDKTEAGEKGKPGKPGKPGNAGSSGQDKQKIIKKTQKLDAKLADWGDDELRSYGGMDVAAAAAGGKSGGGRHPKWDKVVVLKHMFTLAELAEDPAALLDIKEDVREECAKLGEVTNVVLFDLEAEGVISVKFRAAAAAAACVKVMHGRAFGGQLVEAALATGREKYRKSKKDEASDGGSDADD